MMSLIKVNDSHKDMKTFCKILILLHLSAAMGGGICLCFNALRTTHNMDILFNQVVCLI